MGNIERKAEIENKKRGKGERGIACRTGVSFCVFNASARASTKHKVSGEREARCVLKSTEGDQSKTSKA